MIALLLAVAAVSGASPAPRAAPAPAAATAAGGGVLNLSLVEALTGVGQPQLAGLFSFVPERDSPIAFADLLARDRKLLKRYAAKLRADRKAAGGLTAWDHEVCAALVNFYASPLAAGLRKPDAARLSDLNQCVLASVMPLSEIVARRRR
ncbi:MAG: hypothetical protein HY552_04665 [Elusimicrobia bacterium]|nr:hypothetical protein [Elusimicrobiota bacterium]